MEQELKLTNFIHHKFRGQNPNISDFCAVVHLCCVVNHHLQISSIIFGHIYLATVNFPNQETIYVSKRESKSLLFLREAKTCVFINDSLTQNLDSTGSCFITVTHICSLNFH